jgi:DNA-binding NarL/FixJ family response regulator
LQAQVVAAIAPVSLFFSFELLMSQLRTSVKKHSITQNIEQLSQTLSQKQAEVSELDSILAQKSNSVSSLTGEIDTLEAQIVELRKERILTKKGVISPNDTSEQAQNDTPLQQANDTRQAQIEERREQVLILSEQGMSQGDIANELGVSLATIKRDTKALNGRVSQ